MKEWRGAPTQVTLSRRFLTWLSNNPTLRPQYVILFQDLPSRITNAGEYATCSVQYDMNAEL